GSRMDESSVLTADEQKSLDRIRTILNRTKPWLWCVVPAFIVFFVITGACYGYSIYLSAKYHSTENKCGDNRPLTMWLLVNGVTGFIFNLQLAGMLGLIYYYYSVMSTAVSTGRGEDWRAVQRL